MNLDELIYVRISGAEELTRHLARYSGLPAVFSVSAPEDNQGGWEGQAQYPQVVYSFDLQADGERKSVGILTVSLLCRNAAGETPEEIVPEIKRCLRDVILKPAEGSPYCFAWAGTDAFEVEHFELEHFELEYNKTELLVGNEIRFDILEYPSQETTDPDPIMAANKYIKELYPESLIMGYDRMEEITEATPEKPVIYCRLISADKSEETNTVAWMDGRIAVHILCPDSGMRIKMAAAISNSMSLDGEIIMLDHSPMFIKRLQTDYKSDYLKEGQIFITGHYGLLRYRAKPHKMSAVRADYS